MFRYELVVTCLFKILVCFVVTCAWCACYKRFKNPERIEYQAVNISTINSLYPKGGDVTVDDLVKKGAARKGYPVKVLGNGEISVKVTVSAHAFSSSASEKISAAGGSAKTL